MISILHVTTGLDTGGAEAMLARLATRMDRRRFSNRVVSLSGRGRYGADLEASGVPVYGLRMRGGVPGPALTWRLISIIRSLRPAVVQTWLYHADLLGLVASVAVPAATLCWNIRCAQLDPSDHSRSMTIARRLLAAFSSRPAAIVVNSSAGRVAHEELGYHPRRWELIPNGFDLSAFHPDAGRRKTFRARLGLADDALLVGLAARYHPIKDHATFVAAARPIADRVPAARFLLAGRGVDDANTELTSMLERSGIRDRFHLCGDVDDNVSLFNALDIAVCSSYSEAFPNVLGEAMASGVPCVTTRVGEAEALVDGTGRIVPIRDPEALAAAVLDLATMDPASRAALGRTARERIAANYSIDAAVRRYEKLYEDLSSH